MLFEDGQLYRFEADSYCYSLSEIKHTFLPCSEDFMALEVCLPSLKRLPPSNAIQIDKFFTILIKYLDL